MRARLTVIAEGCRGSLAKVLIKRYKLDAKLRPAGLRARHEGAVAAAAGPRAARAWCSTASAGRWIRRPTAAASSITSTDDRAYVGFVTGLDYRDPRFFPFEAFQQFKHHPEMHEFLKGGEILSAGARTISAGGYQSMPKLEMPGAVLVGDSAGTLNVPKIKGIHQALRCAMAAADYFAENNTSIGFDSVWRKTEAVAELHEVRNIKPGFKRGLKLGMLNAGIESMLGGKTPWTLRNQATYPLEKLAEYESPNRHWVNRDLPPRDRLSSVFFAVTAHDEVQPAHLKVRDPNICATTCATEYGNPCTRFCPAQRLRDGRRRGRRQAPADQRRQLRALQGLRHQGPVPDHRLGDAGGRLRS